MFLGEDQNILVYVAGALHSSTFKFQSAIHPSYCYIKWESRREDVMWVVPLLSVHDPRTMDIGSRTRVPTRRYDQRENFHGIQRGAHGGTRRSGGVSGYIRGLNPTEEIDYESVIEIFGLGNDNRRILDRAFISTLPVGRIDESQIGSSEIQIGSTCPICNDVQWVSGLVYRVIPCRNILCIDCITTLVLQGRNFPFCRGSFDAD